MAITVGVQRTVSDRPNVITCTVVLGSDRALPNSLRALTEPDVLKAVYQQLGVQPDAYEIGQLSLSSVVSPYYSQFTYQYALRLVLAGTAVTEPQFIGPPGLVGLPGRPGAPGTRGGQGTPGPTGLASKNTRFFATLRMTKKGEANKGGIRWGRRI